MRCHACAHDNADSALFCAACRRPLVAPSKLPTRLEPLARPALAAAGPTVGVAPGGAGSPSARNRFAPPLGAAASAGADGGALTREQEWAAIVGDANTHYYLIRFEDLATGGRGGWHWPGFFVTWYWMLYRRMWTAALIWFFAPSVFVMGLAIVARGNTALAGVGLLAGWVVHLLLPGFLANRWYFNLCQRRIRDAHARGGSPEQVLARIEAAGGTSNVLVVILALLALVFVVGVLAAIALPAYQTYTVKAQMAQVLAEGDDITAAVGRSYEQTGQLPTDIDRIAADAPHHSAIVKSVALDGTSGSVILNLEAGRVHGALQFVPSADNNHHLSWTCTAPDLGRAAPARCRP